jgi:hypothetical protein
MQLCEASVSVGAEPLANATCFKAEIVRWQRDGFPVARINSSTLTISGHHPIHRLARKREKARVLEEDRLSADRHW